MSLKTKPKKESLKKENQPTNKKKPLGSFKKILVEELNENEIFDIMIHAQYTTATGTCCRTTGTRTAIC